MAEVVKGYNAYVRALAASDKGVRREVRTAFRGVGENIRRDWEQTFSNYDGTQSHTASAKGVKVKVRKRGIAVEQTRPKTTGLHPEYAEAQVRHGRNPAIDGKEWRVEAAMDNALKQVERIFQRGH